MVSRQLVAGEIDQLGNIALRRSIILAAIGLRAACSRTKRNNIRAAFPIGFHRTPRQSRSDLLSQSDFFMLTRYSGAAGCLTLASQDGGAIPEEPTAVVPATEKGGSCADR